MTEGNEHSEGAEETERSTAPQSPYSGGDVVIGWVVALAGMALVFGVPLLLFA